MIPDKLGGRARFSWSESWGAAIPENSPQIATPFGKYVLIKRLATGGMAELFLAQQPPSAELLVIKRILPYLSEEPEFVQMFLDEARIAAQLHHPNVVQVSELGSINESIFIAMEYVEGVDLRRILAEETKFSAAVPYAVASRICSAVAAGLDHAHNSKGMDGRPLGLIHRDVSPQNVMVGYNGAVKLVDFGIAKAEAFAERSKPGVIKGKFLYLSPEQVMQERLDHRSDIFALGVMLYEITTGRTPFARATTEGILSAIRSESPSPPHLIRDDYPQELSRIVMKCLVKDRNQRYQRASQVHADLETLLDSGVMRQSNDVAAYVARLLGGEEERTQLHVPVRRKDPGGTPPPQGLVSRPKLRTPSGQNLPSAVDPEGEELATEMSRPRDMAVAPSALGEEDSDEPTAVGTLPGRAMPSGERSSSPLARSLSRFAEASAEDEAEDSQATAHERLGRGTPANRRPPPPPVRKTPDPLSAMDRRRGPPVPDEDDEEGLSSEAHSVSTVNDRGPGWNPAPHDDEPSEPTAELSRTGPGTARPLALAPDLDDGDADDDESTSAYARPHTSTGVREAPRPPPPSRLRLFLVALLALVLVLAAGAAFVHFTAPPPPPPASPPRASPVPVKPPSAPQPASPEAAPAPTPTPAGTAAAPTSPTPTALPAVGPPPTVGATATTPEPEATPEPTPPDTVGVRFRGPRGITMRVGKAAVKPNEILSLPPGEVKVQFRCPGYRAPKGVRTFSIPEHPTAPVIFTLECRGRGRR